MPKTELHAIASGRVQGVCFRSNVRQIAQKLSLTGTVRNLSDGSVEIFAHGSVTQLEQFIAKLQEHPGLSRVDHLESSYSTPHRCFHDFRIIK